MAQTSLITFSTPPPSDTGNTSETFIPQGPTHVSSHVQHTSGFFSILAAMWNKTSFAITVLPHLRGSDQGTVSGSSSSPSMLRLGFGAMSTYLPPVHACQEAVVPAHAGKVLVLAQVGHYQLQQFFFYSRCVHTYPNIHNMGLY